MDERRRAGQGWIRLGAACIVLQLFLRLMGVTDASAGGLWLSLVLSVAGIALLVVGIVKQVRARRSSR